MVSEARGEGYAQGSGEGGVRREEENTMRRGIEARGGAGRGEGGGQERGSSAGKRAGAGHPRTGLSARGQGTGPRGTRGPADHRRQRRGQWTRLGERRGARSGAAAATAAGTGRTGTTHGHRERLGPVVRGAQHGERQPEAVDVQAGWANQQASSRFLSRDPLEIDNWRVWEEDAGALRPAENGRVAWTQPYESLTGGGAGADGGGAGKINTPVRAFFDTAARGHQQRPTVKESDQSNKSAAPVAGSFAANRRQALAALTPSVQKMFRRTGSYEGQANADTGSRSPDLPSSPGHFAVREPITPGAGQDEFARDTDLRNATDESGRHNDVCQVNAKSMTARAKMKNGKSIVTKWQKQQGNRLRESNDTDGSANDSFYASTDNSKFANSVGMPINADTCPIAAKMDPDLAQMAGNQSDPNETLTTLQFQPFSSRSGIDRLTR